MRHRPPPSAAERAGRWLFLPILLAAGVALTFRLGLAGWAGLIFLLIAAAWQSVRALVMQEIGVGFEASDATDAALMQAVGIAMVPIPALYLATGFPAALDYPAPTLFPLVGTAAGLAGVVLFTRSHMALGRLWSPSLRLRERHVLVTTGPFALVRHPMYAAFFLIAAAQALLLPNALVGPAALVAFAALYRRRMPAEEAMMMQAFGPYWLAYAARTPRLLPRARALLDLLRSGVMGRSSR